MPMCRKETCKSSWKFEILKDENGNGYFIHFTCPDCGREEYSSEIFETYNEAYQFAKWE